LAPSPLVTTRQAVDVARGACPAALDRCEAIFAEQPLNTEGFFEVFVGERQRPELFAFAIAKRQNIIIKTGHLNAAILILERGEQFGQCVGWIRHTAAERAGVQVLLWSPKPKLKICNTAQAVRYGRHAGGELAAVADNNRVAGQLVAI
jgi:hypothetical protein